MFTVGRYPDFGGGRGLGSGRLADDLEVGASIGAVETDREQAVARVDVNAVGLGAEVRPSEASRLQDRLHLASRGRNGDEFQTHGFRSAPFGFDLLPRLPGRAQGNDEIAVWGVDRISIERRRLRDLN